MPASEWDSWLRAEQSRVSLLNRLTTLTTTPDLADDILQPSPSTVSSPSLPPTPLSPVSPLFSSRKRVHFGTATATSSRGTHITDESRTEFSPPITAYRYFCGGKRCNCPATRLFNSPREHFLATTPPTYMCRRALCACDKDKTYVDEEEHNAVAWKNRWRCGDVDCSCDPQEMYVDRKHHDEHVSWAREQGCLKEGNSADPEPKTPTKPSQNPQTSRPDEAEESRRDFSTMPTTTSSHYHLSSPQNSARKNSLPSNMNSDKASCPRTTEGLDTASLLLATRQTDTMAWKWSGGLGGVDQEEDQDELDQWESEMADALSFA